MLYLHPSRAAAVRRGEHLLVEPPVPVSEYTDVFGNRCGRLVAPAGPLRLWNDAIVEDNGLPDQQQPNAVQREIHDLPPSAIQFLLPAGIAKSIRWWTSPAVIRRHSEGLDPGANHLQFRTPAYNIRLSTGTTDAHVF